MSCLRSFQVVGMVALALLSLSCSKRSQTQKSETSEATAHSEAGHQDSAKGKHPEGEAGHHDEHGHEGEAAHPEEGGQRVQLSQETRVASGIEVQPATPRRIRITLDLPGEIVPNADRLAHIVPRFPGIARQVKKGLGQHVREGEVLAVIEGNQSLANYEVSSLLSGTVIEKHVTLGEFVRDDQDIFVIADLSSVWVNVAVYSRDAARVRRGQTVLIEAVGGGPSSQGAIDYIGSVVGEATRAATARVVLSNRDMRWRPGTFVTARIVVDERQVDVAVPDNAIQRLEGRECVFVEDGSGFIARPVTPGKTDGEWVEVLAGLKPGERYAFRGGFILKSELQKAEASHDH